MSKTTRCMYRLEVCCFVCRNAFKILTFLLEQTTPSTRYVESSLISVRDAQQLVIDQLTHFYRRSENFLETFEREYDCCQRRNFRLPILAADADLLVPPVMMTFYSCHHAQSCRQRMFQVLTSSNVCRAIRTRSVDAH